jgi:uncharacterized integral membrane protein (TIGR00698 family)
MRRFEHKGGTVIILPYLQTIDRVERSDHGSDRIGPRVLLLVPGCGLCLLIVLIASGLAALQQKMFGSVFFEPLVGAILAGAILRTMFGSGLLWLPGIHFSGKTLLEIAIVLLGASISVQAVHAAGAALLAGVIFVVCTSLGISYILGRLLGLSPIASILIASGNSICGNSAIAAVAPIVGAEAKDVTAAIGFTALLGVVTVSVLPLVQKWLGFSSVQYGTLAGLIVYAVPQVVAATTPAGVLAVHVGMIVKLLRVLLLCPLIVGLSCVVEVRRKSKRSMTRLLPMWAIVAPWFIIGFLLTTAARSFGLFPEWSLKPIHLTANFLTSLSMAALGLSVDVRTIFRGSLKLSVAVAGSLLALTAISLFVVRLVEP